MGLEFRSRNVKKQTRDEWQNLVKEIDAEVGDIDMVKRIAKVWAQGLGQKERKILSEVYEEYQIMKAAKNIHSQTMLKRDPHEELKKAFHNIIPKKPIKSIKSQNTSKIAHKSSSKSSPKDTPKPSPGPNRILSEHLSLGKETPSIGSFSISSSRPQGSTISNLKASDLGSVISSSKEFSGILSELPDSHPGADPHDSDSCSIDLDLVEQSILEDEQHGLNST